MEASEYHSSGIPTIQEELERNGSPRAEFFTDEDRRAMRIRIPIHPIFLKNPAIGDRNLAIQEGYPAIGDRNPAIQEKNPAIEDRNSTIHFEKVSFETYVTIINTQNYRKSTVDNLIMLYQGISVHQIFGAPEIKEILNCSVTRSKEMMQKLRDMEVVKAVKGYGKGKYRFCYADEMNS